MQINRISQFWCIPCSIHLIAQNKTRPVIEVGAFQFERQKAALTTRNNSSFAPIDITTLIVDNWWKSASRLTRITRCAAMTASLQPKRQKNRSVHACWHCLTWHVFILTPFSGHYIFEKLKREKNRIIQALEATRWKIRLHTTYRTVHHPRARKSCAVSCSFL